ncbi:MAG TPA: IgGFc-binding protein [Kofleriaceae bacterium]|nr:IgGFc-binding protein [Kofleriaceae bacterium]
MFAATACGPEPREDGQPDGGTSCVDGETRCTDNAFEVCSNGNFVVVEQCPAFCTLGGCSSCTGQDCVSDSCMQAGADKSYLGCEYWAVDLQNGREVHGLPIAVPGMECGVYPNTKLIENVKVCRDVNPNSTLIAGRCDPPGDSCPAGYMCQVAPQVCALDALGAPYAIVVSNPNSLIVSVTIENATGVSKTLSLDPGTIKALFPQELGFADQSIDGSGKFPFAYKVTSTAPIVAYQFNPLNDVDVFSNDASLLIPTAGFDERYIAVSYTTLTRRGGSDDYNGWVSVVAAQDDTQIEVIPTANTVGGRDGTPALVAGQTQTFTLNKFEVLNLEAVAGPDPFSNEGLNGGDLTGTVIQGVNGKPFGVFGGHEAVRISAPNSSCCADHLEEMMFPTSTWGKQFAVSRTLPRRDAPDMLRIVAAKSGTSIAFTPPPAEGTCGVLPAGGYCDVRITQPTEVASNEPITVAHLMLSAIQGMEGIGDPSLGIVPPVEQHRADYKFLAPQDYDEQYVNIVAMQGDMVLLDGVQVTSFTPFGARMAAIAPITTGPHTVECPMKCSVEVYGWSQAVSYLFAGGLDLKPIVLQ